MNSKGSAPWRKSSRSGGQGECVEVRRNDGAIQVRDSKNPSGPILAFTPEAWREFVGHVRRGELEPEVVAGPAVSVEVVGRRGL